MSHSTPAACEIIGSIAKSVGSEEAEEGGLLLSGSQWASACLITTTQPDMLSLCQTGQYRKSPFLRSRPPRLQKVGLRKDGNKDAKNFSPYFDREPK